MIETEFKFNPLNGNLIHIPTQSTASKGVFIVSFQLGIMSIPYGWKVVNICPKAHPPHMHISRGV